MKQHRLDSVCIIIDGLGRRFERRWFGWRRITDQEIEEYQQLESDRKQMAKPPWVRTHAD